MFSRFSAIQPSVQNVTVVSWSEREHHITQHRLSQGAQTGTHSPASGWLFGWLAGWLYVIYHSQTTYSAWSSSGWWGASEKGYASAGTEQRWSKVFAVEGSKLNAMHVHKTILRVKIVTSWKQNTRLSLLQQKYEVCVKDVLPRLCCLWVNRSSSNSPQVAEQDQIVIHLISGH